MLRPQLALALGALALSLPLPAQDSAPPGAGALSMRAAVVQALQHHPLLGNVRGQWLQAGAQLRSARGGYYPTVRAGVNAQRGNTDVTNYGSRHVERVELSASQMIWDFGEVRGRVQRAEAGQDVARAQVLQAVDQVSRSTAGAWLDVRRAEALVQTAEAQLAAVRELAELVQKRHAEGASPRSDVSQAQARVDSAQVVLLNAQAQVQRARTALKHLVGSSVLPEVVGEAPDALEDACSGSANAAVGRAAAVQVARAQLAVAERSVDVTRAARLPTVSLDASAGHGLNRRSRRVGEHGVDTSIMLNLTAPLYEGGSLQADTQAAVYAAESARAAVEEARLAAEQGLQDAAVQAAAANSRAQVQEARAAAMETTRALYQQQYLQLGTRSLLDLLNAEEEYHGARSDAIGSRYDALAAGVVCLYQRGDLVALFDLDALLDTALEGAEP